MNAKLAVTLGLYIGTMLSLWISWMTGKPIMHDGLVTMTITSPVIFVWGYCLDTCIAKRIKKH